MIDRPFNGYYKGLKVMVTGGLGFIGSNVAKRLVNLGAQVLVVDNLQANTGGNTANLKGFEDKLEVRLIDLKGCDRHPEIFEGLTAIFNLAGNVSHIDSMIDPIADMGSNVHAQIMLLECCKRYAPRTRIVFASTRQIYGRPVRLPVDENHPLCPVDVNGINKMSAEAYHQLYFRINGLPTVSLRLTNSYGPGMRIKDARQTFLGIWLRHVVQDTAFEVWGGQQLRDFTYIDDVVDSFLLAGWCSGMPGRTFNIGGGPVVSLLDLANLLVEIGGTGRFEVREFPPDRLLIDIGDYCTDDRAFREITGWAPVTTLQEGLRRTVAHYRYCLEEYV
jgi:UDP-glucose 4-epimerase